MESDFRAKLVNPRKSVALFFLCNVFPLEHLQHAIGNDETTDDICCRTDDRDETKNRADRVVMRARRHD